MPVDPPHQVRVPSKPLEAPGDEPPPSKVSAEIPGWIRQVGYDVGLKPELIMAAVSGKPELVDKLKRVQQELNEPIVEAIVARDKLVGQISLARQAEGRYEVFRHGQRLPDPDPRYGEYIATGYEPEPEGGPDRVRIIRILPGENAEFDRARTRVIDLEAARRTAILFLLRLQPR